MHDHQQHIQVHHEIFGREGGGVCVGKVTESGRMVLCVVDKWVPRFLSVLSVWSGCAVFARCVNLEPYPSHTHTPTHTHAHTTYVPTCTHHTCPYLHTPHMPQPAHTTHAPTPHTPLPAHTTLAPYLHTRFDEGLVSWVACTLAQRTIAPGMSIAIAPPLVPRGHLGCSARRVVVMKGSEPMTETMLKRQPK